MSLTRMGKFFLVLILVMLISGINTRTNILHVLTSFLIIILIFSPWLIERNLKKITASISAPEEIFVEEICQIKYIVCNKSVYHKYSLLCKDTSLPCTFFACHIPPGDSISLAHNDSFTKRGVKKWEKIEVQTQYPFGFFSARQNIALSHSLFILPKPLLLSLPLSIQMEFGKGTIASMRRSASDDLAGLRDYQPGDSLKSIHWKASAKNDKLIVKEYEEDLPATVSIVMDIALESGDIFEEMISLSASVIAEVGNKGYRFIFLGPKENGLLGNGPNHIRKTLRFLATAKAVHVSENDYLEQLSKQLPNVGAIIFLTFTITPKTASFLQNLLRSGREVMVISLRETKEKDFAMPVYRASSIASEKIVLERM